jgi:hypothetical protein
VSEDYVQTADDRRTLNDNGLSMEMPVSLAELLKEAGRSDDEIKEIADAMRSHANDPLSTFEITTFHPRCNEPIDAASLAPTDGSL